MLTRRTLSALVLLALLPKCNAASDSSSTERGSASKADDYEFVVVGSGAGGGPLAARLARAGHRVLLVEAGEDVGGNPKHDVPAMHALATEDASMAWWFFVSHSADAQVDREDTKWTPEGILYPRGSALGGSTAVNAMVTILPSRSDWNRLADLTGDRSFRADAMDKYIDSVREWLSVEMPDPSLALGDAKVTAEITAAAHVANSSPTNGLASVLGRDINEGLRRGETTGLFRIPLATKDGRRNGPREFILDTIAQGFPLTLQTSTFATRILFEGDTAKGVEVVRGAKVYSASLDRQKAANPDREQLFASREVIVAAGAFNSPQLLMLSGVGDRAKLQDKKIGLTVERPGVGMNLQDRVEAAVVSEFATPLDVVSRCNLGKSAAEDPCLAEWETDARGVYRTPGFLATALVRSTPNLPLADLQIFAVPSDARGYYPGYSKDSAAAKNRFSWLILKAHTKNDDGSVTLRDASPFTRPVIAFRSFDEKAPEKDEDLRAVVKGVHFIRDIIAKTGEAMPNDAPKEIWPGPQKATDDELASWIRREAWGHHACCTDRMGDPEDPNAVVDSHFRVIGAKHLRVVDASVFPEIPGTFIAFPTYMLAEKAAATILEDAAK